MERTAASSSVNSVLEMTYNFCHCASLTRVSRRHENSRDIPNDPDRIYLLVFARFSAAAPAHAEPSHAPIDRCPTNFHRLCRLLRIPLRTLQCFDELSPLCNGALVDR